jgi:hypothetical protein
MTQDQEPVDAELVEDPPTTPVPAAAYAPSVPEPDYSDGGVPSFDFVRDRIEQRYTTSVGATEVAGLGTDNTVEALDKKIADRDQAAKDKLEQIRRSMRGE